MHVVAHDGKAHHIDPEQSGQLDQPLAQPPAPVVERLAGGLVAAHQEGPPHAAIRDVVNIDFPLIDQIGTIFPRHAVHLPTRIIPPRAI